MLVIGTQLLPATRRAVLRMFPYRPTIENNYPRYNPAGCTIPPVTDAEWLASHAFYVTISGELAKRPNYCEPAFMAQTEAK